MRHEKLTQLLDPVIQALGLECLGVEYMPQKNSGLLRVWIDVTDRFVNLDDCERVSHEVSAALDLADPIQGKYTLEVTSPGIERPLFTLAQFARAQGQWVKVSTHVPVNARRNFKGELVGIEDDQITLNQDGVIIQIQYDNIAKAHLTKTDELGANKKQAAKKGTTKATNNKKKVIAP